MMRFSVLLICLLIGFSGFAQKNKKVILCELITSVEQSVIRIERNGQDQKGNDRSTFEYNLQLVERLQNELDSISWFQQRAAQLRFSHTFSPKFFHQWINVQHSLSQLKESIVVYQAYESTLPDSLNGHVGPNKREWKDRFDPWIQDVYKYNIEPSIENAAVLPVILGYRRFRSDMRLMRDALPEKWQQRIIDHKCCK